VDAAVVPDIRRQCVFGRLAGYEDVNDAERLRHNPAMRWLRIYFRADAFAMAGVPRRRPPPRWRLSSWRSQLAGGFWGLKITDELVVQLSKDAAVLWLDAIATKAITAHMEPTEQPFATILNGFSRFLLGRNWRYWLTELEDQLINPVDILTLPLPSQFRAFYPLLRLPLWLWRHGRHRDL
jgi:hypothetical protein